jgi:hypothetical protein
MYMTPRLTNLMLALPHLLLGLLTAGLLTLAEFDGRGFRRLMQEDGWAEWATFAAFAMAAWFTLRRARDDLSPLYRAWLIGLGIFCIFVAGEEISWGQRLFGYRPPDFFLEQNFQQEANLHNLLKSWLDTRFVVMAIAIAYGVIGPLLGFLLLVPRALVPKPALIPYFALIAWLELGYPYELVGELAELLLGLAFLFDSAERSTPFAHSAATRSAAGQMAALAAALLLVPLNDTVMLLHGEQFAQAARTELAHIAERLGDSSTLRDRLFRKQHVHKRLYTAARAGYLELPAGEYALDPWNNPYWLAFRKAANGDAEVLIYSFGANHRRESDIDNFAEDAFRFGGDDLGVIVHVNHAARADRL